MPWFSETGEIISRKDARERGLTRYFTGKPCPSAHIGMRYVSTNACVRCNQLAARAWVNKTPRALAKQKAATAAWGASHRPERNAATAAWRKAHPEWLSEYNRRHYIRRRSTPEGHRKDNIRIREYKKRNPKQRLMNRLRCRLYDAIRGNAKRGSAVRDLGCTAQEFMAFIAAQFAPGMSWDNWGKIWHLDHIEPLGDFDLSDREQFLRAVHYSNHQPLSVEDHRKKTGKENGNRLRKEAA